MFFFYIKDRGGREYSGFVIAGERYILKYFLRVVAQKQAIAVFAVCSLVISS